MASSHSSNILTYAIPGFKNDAGFVASVVAVNPTATTLAMKCSNPDSQHCHTDMVTATFGPWAQVNPPASASTGTFDFFMSGYAPDKWLSSVHCELVSTTVPLVCTLSHNAERPITHGTTTTTQTVTDYTALASPATDYWAVETVSILVTDGFEKFGAATTSEFATPSSTATPHMTGTQESPLQSASVTTTSSSTSSVTASIPSASSKSGGVATTSDVSIGTAGLIALLATFLTR